MCHFELRPDLHARWELRVIESRARPPALADSVALRSLSGRMIRFNLPTVPVCGAATFQDRGRWFMPTLAVLLALGIGAFIGARPAWRYVRTQRAMGLMARAEVLANEKKWSEVAPLLKSSLALAPSNLRCYRLAARYFTAQGSPQALVYWEQVLASGTATYEERREFAALTAALNRPDLCRPLVDQLLREKPSDPALYRIQMNMARRMKLADLRANTAERWLRVAPEDAEAQFELASVRWPSEKPDQRRLGHRLLWGLAFGSNTYSLAAIATLAQGTNTTRSETDLLWRRLDALAVTNRFVEADLRLRLRPETKASLMRGLVESLTPEAPLSEVAETVKWLADRGAVQELLPLLTPERVKRSSALELARIQALIEVGRLPEIQAALASPPTNAPAYLIHCLRASAAFAEGAPERVGAHLEQAAAAANRDSKGLLIVVRFAEVFHQPRIALAGWRDLAEKFGGGLDAVMEIMRLARKVDDLPSAQPAVSALRNRMATDVGAALLAGYVESMVGRMKPPVLAQLREIVRTNSPAIHYIGVLGLAEWRSGDPNGALRVMEAQGMDWAKAEPRFQAVYAAVLGAAGQREAARNVARRIPAEQLVREERALLEPWL